MKPLDMNLLAALHVLLEEGSVVKAARRMDMSTPAMSRTLARIREMVGDPVMVRAGRGLLPTPRALELQDQVVRLVEQAQGLFASFSHQADLSTLRRTFSLRANDVFVGAYSGLLRESLHRQAPLSTLRFVPEADDEDFFNKGTVDLYIGAPHRFGADVKTQALFDTAFVGLARKDHPIFDAEIDVARFASFSHISVSRRGRASGPIDAALAEQGYERQVSLITPGFHAAIFALLDSDLVLPLMPRNMLPNVARMGLAVRPFVLPIPLKTVVIVQAWQPRMNGDAVHRWLRQEIKRTCGDARDGPQKNVPRTETVCHPSADGNKDGQHHQV